MKKNLIYKVCLFFIALLFSENLIAQSVKDIVDLKIKTVYSKTVDARKTQKSIKHNITKYDKHGNVIEAIELNDDSVITKWEKFKYNNHDDETEYQLSDTAGNVTKTTITTYDKWNQEAEKITKDASGKVLEKVASTYDVNNNKILETTTDKDGIIIRKVLFEYDNKGMIKSRKFYNEKGELTYSKEHIYN
ncbi:MAG: hypothetical protein ABI723_04720 [Bacteroidia bacterium]